MATSRRSSPSLAPTTGTSLGTKTTAGATHMVSLPARKKTGLPYVCWEARISLDRESKAACLDYPLDPPIEGESLVSDPKFLVAAARDSIRRLLGSNLHEGLGLTKAAMTECSAKAEWHEPMHHGFREVFCRWKVDEVMLFSHAHIRLADGVIQAARHLVPTGAPEMVFTNGAGFVAHPKYVAWRTWIDYSEKTVECYDHLMDLRSFAWYALQHDIAADHVILGGSFIKEGRDRHVLSAKRLPRGWMVDRWKEDEPASVLITSILKNTTLEQ